MSSHAVLSLPEEQRTLTDDIAPKAKRVAGVLLLVGLLLSAVVSLWHYPRFHAAYLIAFSFLLSLTLGGLFFVIIQHLVRAGWSVTVRRVAEAIAYNFKILPILFLPLIPGIYQGKLMPQAGVHAGAHAAPAEHGAEAAAVAEAAAKGDWAHGPAIEGMAHGVMDHAKETWLSFPWVIGRLALFFALWFLIARFYYTTSIKQDETGDPELTARMQRWSAPAIVVFALTASLGGFDLLMALDPHWYSTIFGVYFFAGGFLSFNATLIITLYLLQRTGHITKSVSPEHYHDVGKFMFAFVVFWAYIGYSQYMLIWYGNIPEESVWYLIRQTGDWGYVGLFLVFGHFALPFLLLISRFPKRRPALLALGAAYILAVHFVDLFWIVAPQKAPLGRLPVPLLELFLLVGLTGIYLLSTVSNLRGIQLIPIRDPRLVEALNHENY